MSWTQLLPTRIRRGLRRLRQDARDLAIALSTPRRPVARAGTLTDPDIYSTAVTRRARIMRAMRDDLATEGSQAPAHARIHFRDRGATIAVREGQTILEAGLEAGLDLEFSCTLGGCAACALQLVDGEVVYDGPNCLSDAERDSGMCLACVGRPRGSVIVEPLY